MSCVWVSAQECSQQELVRLAEMVRRERDMQIVFFNDPPTETKRRFSMESKVADLLVRLGVRPNLKGYQYLLASVKICLKDREELDGITKRLYPSVAKKHGTTADKVEHAIRYAIQTAWKKGNRREHQAVFGYDISDGKSPTNTEFIMQMLVCLEKMEGPLYS